MSDGLTASSLRDGFARCSAKHAAALACAEGVVVAGRAVAVAGSDPASVVAAAPVAACPGSASVAVPAWLIPSPFAVDWADLVCLSFAPAQKQEQ